MGLRSSLSSLARGEFRDAFSYAFVDEDVITAGNRADDGLTKLVQEKYAAGAVTAQEANETLARIQLNAFPSGNRAGGIFTQPGTDVAGGFVEGLHEGADNIGKFATKTIGTATSLTWKIIPWQVWVALFVIAVVYAWPFIGPALSAAAVSRFSKR